MDILLPVHALRVGARLLLMSAEILAPNPVSRSESTVLVLKVNTNTYFILSPSSKSHGQLARAFVTLGKGPDRAHMSQQRQPSTPRRPHGGRLCSSGGSKYIHTPSSANSQHPPVPHNPIGSVARPESPVSVLITNISLILFQAFTVRVTRHCHESHRGSSFKYACHSGSPLASGTLPLPLPRHATPRIQIRTQ